MTKSANREVPRERAGEDWQAAFARETELRAELAKRLASMEARRVAPSFADIRVERLGDLPPQLWKASLGSLGSVAPTEAEAIGRLVLMLRMDAAREVRPC